MADKIIQLYDLVDPSGQTTVLDEVKTLAKGMGFTKEAGIIEDVQNDIVRLFKGEYPGYQASNTKYHDLEHTLSVVLATARLMHGCSQHHETCSPRSFCNGIIAAYFHDTGLIQADNDQDGTGAKYTVGHEQRSIDLMKDVLGAKGFAAQDLRDIADMINCTILANNPREVSFASPEAQRAGFVLGTADLLAQIADRNYLEKLLLLFKEFAEAGLPGFESELDLLQKTGGFYHQVAKPRLDGPLGDQGRFMILHFQKRWDLNRDLYAESIAKNLNHLEDLLSRCGDSYECLLKALKRGGIGYSELKNHYDS